MSHPILQIEQISKAYRGRKAIEGLEFKIEAGECLALLGPNGAGKSTTVEIIAGLKNADSGVVKVFGYDWHSHRKEIYQKLGILLQETHLYKKLTVLETIQLFSSFYQDPMPTEALLKEFDLQDHQNKRLHELSGGLKQRLYLACAFVNNPDLVLLDEPTTGLDPQSRRFVWDKIRKFKSIGKAVLLTTHYMEEAQQLADVVLILDQAKVIAQGTPQKLIREYCKGARVEFYFNPEDFNKVESLRSSCDFDHFNIMDLSFSFLSNQVEVDIPKVQDLAKRFQIQLDRFAVFNPNLEEVFIQLTGKGLRDE